MNKLFSTALMCLSMAMLVGCEDMGDFSLGKSDKKEGTTAEKTPAKSSTGTAAGESKYTLPFPVMIGGQKAAPLNSTCASIADPVAVNAPIEVGVDMASSEQVIVNAFKSSADGTVESGAQAAAILVFKKGEEKSSLDKEMQNKKLAAGTYTANIVAKGKTARVVFTVK